MHREGRDNNYFIKIQSLTENCILEISFMECHVRIIHTEKTKSILTFESLSWILRVNPYAKLIAIWPNLSPKTTHYGQDFFL